MPVPGSVGGAGVPGAGTAAGAAAGASIPQPGSVAGVPVSGWGQMAGAPVGPWGVQRPMPPVRREPRTPWWQRDGVISRLLAVAGVAVTLIGVVMLLVLAAQAGFFGPVLRVVAGAVFSVALLAVGMRVFGRSGGRTGGIALAATGIAGAYLEVVAVTAIYHWVPAELGLVLALMVAAGGVALAIRWGAQALAVLVVSGAALLSPALTGELVLLAFLIVLQGAFLPVQLRRDWPLLHIARTLPVALGVLFYMAGTAFETPGRDRLYWLLAAAVAVAAIGLIGTLLAVRTRPRDFTATAAFALSTLPLLAAPALFDPATAAIISGSFAVALLALAATGFVPKLAAALRIPAHTTVVAAIAGSFALFEACLGVTRVQTLPIALFLVALGYFAIAGQLHAKVPAAIGIAFAALGAMLFVGQASPATLASQHLASENLGISTTLAAVLALAVAATALWSLRRLPGVADPGTESGLWITASLTGLYAVTAATVSLGVASATRDGFRIGHTAATILWMIAATAALLFGLRMLAHSAALAKTALVSGLLVTAAALAKLFLFDLATLDGLLRAAAFLVVGVLLLLAGTRYARAFADANNDSARN
ncbi:MULTISPECIES: DUF2339 domain-containing protein [unclassified Nocardia]|uniref:DUF2339 domain-containing protein n=1 Tax=unclassified Nocardia TaxID=2637762 RepID=UPI00272ECB36|nr:MULTISPECIES: DUF2339 domain-containing protein [unclassified Nocardia]